MTWPFQDPPNVLVFTSKDVIELNSWIYYVSHDEEDGAWQFHSRNGAPEHEADSRLVLLTNIVRHDPSLLELADLPLGWCAWRQSPTSPWQRKNK